MEIHEIRASWSFKGGSPSPLTPALSPTLGRGGQISVLWPHGIGLKAILPKNHSFSGHPEWPRSMGIHWSPSPFLRGQGRGEELGGRRPANAPPSLRRLIPEKRVTICANEFFPGLVGNGQPQTSLRRRKWDEPDKARNLRQRPGQCAAPLSSASRAA
jgi:hypothetical protein